MSYRLRMDGSRRLRMGGDGYALRMGEHVVDAPPPGDVPIVTSAGGSGSSASISLSQWLRRIEARAAAEAPVAAAAPVALAALDAGAAASLARKRRRRAEEEFLCLMGSTK